MNPNIFFKGEEPIKPVKTKKKIFETEENQLLIKAEDAQQKS